MNASKTNLDDQIQRIIKCEFDYCAKHIVYWANNYCVIEDKNAPDVIVPFKGWDAQNKTLEEIDNNRLNLILKARQMGITWIVLYYCTHDLIFNPGHTVVALSKTEDDAKELVRRMGVILDNQPQILKAGGLEWRQTATTIQITNANNKVVSTFKAFPASPSAGRSFTANILMLDEWAFQEFAEEIWISAYPTINSPAGGKVIGLSTIKRGTLFESLWTANNNFHKIFLSVFCDPRRTQEWYDQTEADIGVKIKQEYPRTAEEALSNLGGSYFPEFSPLVHVIDPPPVPTEWRRFRCIDYGLDRFACHWLAINSMREIVCYRSYCESNLTISDAAKAMIEYSLSPDGTPEDIYCTYAPPDMWSRTQETGQCKADIFYQHGVALTKTSNDREAGWLAIKELLKIREDGTPRLRISRACPELIRCLPQLQIDPKRPTDCKTEPHEITHAPDALRAFAISWARPAPEQDTSKRTDWTKDMWQDYYSADTAGKAYLLKKYGKPNGG